MEKSDGAVPTAFGLGVDSTDARTAFAGAEACIQDFDINLGADGRGARLGQADFSW